LQIPPRSIAKEQHASFQKLYQEISVHYEGWINGTVAKPGRRGYFRHGDVRELHRAFSAESSLAIKRILAT
jgi:hypothetical protein